MKLIRNLISAIAMLSVLILNISCKDNKAEMFQNPIIKSSQSTSFYYHEGKYYYLRNSNGHIMISAMEDPSDFKRENEKSACNMLEQYSLTHLWCPQLTRIDDAWYIYVTADDGDTDNHRMYVLENRNSNPMKGSFTLLGKIHTDTEDNWAMHGHVFNHNNRLYMVWSGWQDERLYAETQCLYIASMDSPSTLSSQRIIISKPEYEWELQWINNDGRSATRYPVYVNECPFYFNNEYTDKIHIFYSASANWTSYHCIGELTAEKGSDILDPESWKKSPLPVFKGDNGKDVIGPDNPSIIPAPDMKNFYLVFAGLRYYDGLYERDVYCQPINITEGRPVLGEPVGKQEYIRKISTLH